MQMSWRELRHVKTIGERYLGSRHQDGSAGDANYGAIGQGYAAYRQPAPEIAGFLSRALGGARSVLNVGAGAGSYEPVDREVTAVEPSASMRRQRPAYLPVAIEGVAEKLPFADQSFDASMATFTVHQWNDLAAGLIEMRRVTRGPVAILTCDPLQLHRSWLAEYAPEMISVEIRRYPLISTIAEALGGADVVFVPIPLQCSDGFSEAYYGRPERLLEAGARLANSAWSFVEPDAEQRFVKWLDHDIKSGAWDAKYGQLRRQSHFDGSLRLIVGTRKW
jgi:SAM-dependent methyltransferase